jgi:hypothetical protein
LTTLPAFRQEVHTLTRLGDPFTIARTRCTLGFQRRRVRRCEWLNRIPKTGFLPQTSHTDDMNEHLGRERDDEITAAGVIPPAITERRTLAPTPAPTPVERPARQ